MIEYDDYDMYNDYDEWDNYEFMKLINEDYCYSNCDFTFKDEVNLSHKSYDKRTKNYCNTFRLKLHSEFRRLERLKNKIAENSTLINEKPNDWKKYVPKEIEYITFFNEEKNK